MKTQNVIFGFVTEDIIVDSKFKRGQKVRCINEPNITATIRTVVSNGIKFFYEIEYHGVGNHRVYRLAESSLVAVEE